MGLRRKSRELALQFLFGRDFQQHSGEPGDLEAKLEAELEVELERFCESFDAGEKALPYAKQLLAGIGPRLEEIDVILSDHSHNWRLERMSPVDRNILRIAIFEMCFSDKIPERVAINEALEVAKRFSMNDSLPFINGVLDSVQGREETASNMEIT